MSKKIGYARVSTVDQHPELQINALKEAGCDYIFCDHGESGAKRNRPELQRALRKLEPGDKLLVWKIDRLARSMSHLSILLESFKDENIDFESLTEKMDTDSAYGEFVFHIMAGYAHMERRIISERTIAGLREAAKKGRYPGRPKIAK